MSDKPQKIFQRIVDRGRETEALCLGKNQTCTVGGSHDRSERRIVEIQGTDEPGI
jgi:hypothetical protein